MDRRSSNQVPIDPVEKGLRDAIDVIMHSYNGEAPDGLFRDAIRCFDSLIDISHGTDLIQEFAVRQGMDMKYLVDGANFVISKMHFNPDNNYYVTLGLPRDASAEELKHRWKRLMMLYHPDRQIGEEGWVSERAKKVNEAYSVLKDGRRREEYDRTLHSSSASLHASPKGRGYRGPAPHLSRQGLRKSLNSSRSVLSSPLGAKTRRYLPKAMIALYLLVSAAILCLIYLQNRSSRLELELASAGPFTKGAGTEKAQIPLSAVNYSIPPGVQTGLPQSDGNRKPASAVSSDEKRIAIIRQTISHFSGPASTADVPSVSPASTDQSSRQAGQMTADTAGAQAQGLTPISTAVAVETPREARLPAPAAAEPFVQRREVEEFMGRYIDAYGRNDLNALMSLFSPNAVENGIMRYQEIYEAYRQTFSEKINYYRIEGMTISLNGMTATVAGNYELSRKMSGAAGFARFSGRISWKIAKDGNALRIVSMTYDR